MAGAHGRLICQADGCLRPAEAHRQLCSAHRKQLQRHGRLTPVRESPETAVARLELAALRLADADADDDGRYAAARRAFLAAFRAATRELYKAPGAVLSPRGHRLRR